jgi:hypothetical protein
VGIDQRQGALILWEGRVIHRTSGTIFTL